MRKAIISVNFEKSNIFLENIKKNAIGSVIEKVEPHWIEPGRREYHGMTRGWVANEVFRRAHPKVLEILVSK